MATTEKWLVSGTNETLLNTGASLANNAAALSGAITPTDANYPYLQLEFVGTFGTAPTANTGIAIWFIQRPDGTNYEDGDATPITPARMPDCFIPVRTVTTAQRVVRRCIIPPGTFKVLAKNDGTGQTLSSGWTVKGLPLTRQGV